MTQSPGKISGAAQSKQTCQASPVSELKITAHGRKLSFGIDPMTIPQFAHSAFSKEKSKAPADRVCSASSAVSTTINPKLITLKFYHRLRSR